MRFPDIPMIDFFGRGGALKPSWSATVCRAATSPCSSTSTSRVASTSTASSPRRFTLDDVEGAFERMQKGEVLRSVVLFE